MQGDRLGQLSQVIFHGGGFRGYSWLFVQGSFLVVPKGPYGILMIKPRSATCKANALLTMLSLQPSFYK